MVNRLALAVLALALPLSACAHRRCCPAVEATTPGQSYAELKARAERAEVALVRAVAAIEQMHAMIEVLQAEKQAKAIAQPKINLTLQARLEQYSWDSLDAPSQPPLTPEEESAATQRRWTLKLTGNPEEGR
jgi:hypothetical protein